MTLWAARTTNVPVSFDKLRKVWLMAPMQEGVAGATDLKVSQRAAGANMSVDIAPGGFWIKTDIDTPDGLVAGYSDAISNQTVTASHATLPRIDSLYVQYNDSSLGAGVGGDTPTFRVLAGTATSGAQATNFAGANYRAGAAAAPNDALLIADIPVPAAATSITNANIVDRRPWARGAFSRQLTTSPGGVVGNTSFAEYDGTNMKVRIECSGVPIRITVQGTAAPTGSSGTVVMAYSVDGDVSGTATVRARWQAVTVGANYMVQLSWIDIPTPGSHVYSLVLRVTAGAFQFTGTPDGQREWIVEEIVRPNANNS